MSKTCLNTFLPFSIDNNAIPFAPLLTHLRNFLFQVSISAQAVAFGF